jgi:hypothetical protein
MNNKTLFDSFQELVHCNEKKSSQTVCISLSVSVRNYDDGGRFFTLTTPT